MSRTFAPRDGAQFASLSSFKTTNSRLGGLMTRMLGPRPRVRFVATAPREFGAMRDGAGVDFERLQLSIESIEHAGGGLKGGASGAFLFPSQDGQLVVKTLSLEEAAALHKLAPSFARHFHDQPASYINRFLGQFSMYLYGRTIHFVVLRSAFHLHGDVSPAVRYDLKGSWVNRTGKPGQSVRLFHPPPSPPLPLPSQPARLPRPSLRPVARRSSRTTTCVATGSAASAPASTTARRSRSSFPRRSTPS